MFVNLFKLILIATLISACSKTTEHQSVQGGQDSGGGNTSRSSIAEVSSYFDRSLGVLEYSFRTFLHKETIYGFKDDKKRKLLYELSQRTAYLDKENNELRRGVSILVNSSKINVEENRACSSIDKIHASASINKLEVGSNICISFLELTRVPSASLEKEIIGLLLHEYSHALGFNENDAEQIQLALLVNFDRIFPFGAKQFAPTDKGIRIDRDMDAFSYRKSQLKNAIEIETEPVKEICTSLNEIALIAVALQREELFLLNKLSAELIASGDMTSAQVDTKQNETYNISEKILNLSYSCPVKAPLKQEISDLVYELLKSVQVTSDAINNFN